MNLERSSLPMNVHGVKLGTWRRHTPVLPQDYVQYIYNRRMTKIKVESVTIISNACSIHCSLLPISFSFWSRDGCGSSRFHESPSINSSSLSTIFQETILHLRWQLMVILLAYIVYPRSISFVALLIQPFGCKEFRRCIVWHINLCLPCALAVDRPCTMDR